MRIGSLCFLVVAVLTWVAISPSQMLAQTGPELIAVLDLEPVEATGAEASAISDRLREELLRSGKFTLVERERLTQVVEEQTLQQANCTDQACAAQVGRFLGVSRIITGRVTKLTSTSWQVSASMVDVQTAETIRAESVLHEGDMVTLLRNEIPELGAKLARIPPPRILPDAVSEKSAPPNGAGESTDPLPGKLGFRVYLAPIDAGGVTLDYKNKEGNSVTDALTGGGFTAGLDYFLSGGAVVFLLGRYGTFEEWERTSDGSSTELTGVSGNYSSLAGGVDVVFGQDGPGRFLMGVGVYNTWASFEGTNETTGEEFDGDANVLGLLLDLRGDYTFSNGVFAGAALQFKSGIASGSAVEGDESASGSATHVFFALGYGF